MTEKRFINDVDNGKWEFLNKLNDENEQLKKENQQLKKENQQLQRSGLIEICKEQEKKIIQLKKELYEALEQYYYEAYSDNPVRRDKHIVYMKKEFKEKYGDVE